MGYLLSLLVLASLGMVMPHPICLDGKAPFVPEEAHPFCPEYTDFGCCSQSDFDTLVRRRDAAKDDMGDAKWAECGEYMERLLCQRCSPYAGHIFNAETSDNPLNFPALCSDYCGTFYDSCKDIVQYLDPSLVPMVVNGSKEEFCGHLELNDPDYCYPDLLTNDVLNGPFTNVQVTGEGCLCVEEMLGNLFRPVAAVRSGDGSNRLFVIEQLGYVYIFYPENKTLLETPFLNLTHRVVVIQDTWEERGLLNIAFHPNYTENGKFYVFYGGYVGPYDDLDPYGLGFDINHKTRISEFRVSQTDPNKADPTSERILMEIPQPYQNHNGGELLFGNDGYLYIVLGDGGFGHDPHDLAQNKSVLFAKILRIDVDTPHQSLQYSIPPDNPFVEENGTRPEIYALGLRNAWRCAIDQGDRETGEGRDRFICGDVGQELYEELDLIEKGGNYGWSAREGPECFKNETCGKIGPEVMPLLAYNHTIGKSVTGGLFYRGCESPNLNGMYIYGDYMNGRLFRLLQNMTTGEWSNRELFMCGDDVCNSGLQGQYKTFIISFGQDDYGELYFMSMQETLPFSRDGTIYKLVDPARRGNPADCRHDLEDSSTPEPTAEPEDTTQVQWLDPGPADCSVQVGATHTWMSLLVAAMVWTKLWC